jgi:hypothetical protein
MQKFSNQALVMKDKLRSLRAAKCMVIIHTYSFCAPKRANLILCSRQEKQVSRLPNSHKMEKEICLKNDTMEI